jgi:hypothetical protein
MRSSRNMSVSRYLFVPFIGLVGVLSAVLGLPAQAAGNWSAPVGLPGNCGGSSIRLPSIAVNASGAQVAGASYQDPDNNIRTAVCTSPDGQTWSGPTVLGWGVAPSVAVGPDGRAIVAWEGGSALAPVVEAAVQPSGGVWSSPVVVGTDAGNPVVRMDGHGNAVVAWAASSGAVYTASLPAGGKWTAPFTLAGTRMAGFRGGYNPDVALNSSGSAIIVWNEYDAAIEASSGTVLGGFAAPVAVDGAYTKGLQPKVALNDSGYASLAWSSGQDNRVATRTPAGTWSAVTTLATSSGGQAGTAIDAAGDALVVFEASPTSTSTPLYASWRPAGGTWALPVLLASTSYPTVNRVGADGAGTFVVAYNDTTMTTADAFTVSALGAFGQPTAVGPSSVMTLAVASGHATIICGSQATDEAIS